MVNVLLKKVKQPSKICQGVFSPFEKKKIVKISLVTIISKLKLIANDIISLANFILVCSYLCMIMQWIKFKYNKRCLQNENKCIKFNVLVNRKYLNIKLEI